MQQQLLEPQGSDVFRCGCMGIATQVVRLCDVNVILVGASARRNGEGSEQDGHKLE